MTWIHRIVAAARAADGVVGVDATPPATTAERDWAVVYRFHDVRALDAWLTSDERADLLRQGADLIDGEAREQRIAVVDTEPVTAISSVRIHPDHLKEYRRHFVRVEDALHDAPGFLRVELFEPVAGVQEEAVVVLTFTTKEHLDAWLTSDRRQELLDEAEPLVDSNRTVNVVGSYAGWFGGDEERPVKRWKQAVVVLTALYPTSLVLGAVRDALAPDLPSVAGVLVGNVLGVAVLTWLLMPVLTRLLAGWLRS